MSVPRQITFQGRTYPVVDRLRVQRTEYLVTARLGRSGRERYQVFDRTLWPEGELRVIHILPKSRHALQQLRVLKRVGRSQHRVAPRIHECQPRKNKIYVVTDWEAGQDLQSYLRDAREGRIAWPSAFISFGLARRFVHGLSQLHDYAHIVHGDLKPENVILQTRPTRLTLIDFGSAWLTERAVSRETGDGVTLGYAAPELRVSSALADWRADQFSTSVMLYELLTGALPYDGLGGMAGWPENRDDFEPTYIPPSAARRGASDLPADAWWRIDEVIARGLQLDPAARFDTPADWRADLDTIASVLHAPSTLGPFGRRAVRATEWLLEKFPWPTK